MSLDRDHQGRHSYTIVPGITCAEEALVWASSQAQGLNVVDASGAPVLDALTYMLGEKVYPKMVPPQQWPDCDRLPGTWLYAGAYWSHFGHYLFESLARIWALEHLDQKIDGILFAWARGKQVPHHAEQGFQAELLARCGGGTLPVRIVNYPIRVERLVVPRQGVALGPMAVGTPEFRSFIRRRLREGSAPGPHKRVYISRQGFGLRRGGLFDEGRLVHLLEAEGYHAFRPERVSLQEQINTYLGAEQIVSTDNSALHLVAFLAREGQRVAMLLRRSDGGKDIVPNLTGCMGAAPVVVDRISHVHRNTAQRHPNWGTYAELDLPAVAADLHGNGFISTPEAWPAMRHRRRVRLLADYARRTQGLYETEVLS